jgi:hypothetical protein
LRHGHNAVIELDFLARLGGSVHQFLDLAVSILIPEDGANARQGQIHHHGKIFILVRPLVIRVRIIRTRERIQVLVQDIIAVIVLKNFQGAVVVFPERLHNFVVHRLGRSGFFHVVGGGDLL